ncbi:MAG TPA: hypothetical protein DCR93_35110, partial [Cytophagales bacterium]|nr:hypothetical protein [Cytophagales bacterium]
MKLSFRLSLFFLYLLSTTLSAQVTLNTNPGKLKWYYLNTEHFKIIYPEKNEPLAQRTANIMEAIYEPVSATMGVKPKPISIILQNQTTVSNGFVSYAPRRSEFFTMPPQDYNFIGTNQWLPFLAIHEYRHVAQFQRAYTGWNKLNYFLAGEAGFGGFTFLVLPSWYWEGDAVGIETAFTPSGRGRIPEFNMQFRTTLLERGPWSYSKQYLRSYKHFIPNHYITGYYLTSYVREQTGDPHIWEKVAARAVKFPYLPFRMGYALKKETGLNMTKTYNAMTAEMQDRWKRQQDAFTMTEASAENVRKGKRPVFTNYQFPMPLSDGRVAVIKSGLGDISQLVVLNPEGKEERQMFLGSITNAGQVTEGGGRVAWIENEFDPRFRAKDYGVIRLYDLTTGKYTRLTKKTRYTTSAISPNGEQVAALAVDVEGKQVLDVLSIATGEVLSSHAFAEGAEVAMPRWMPDGKSLVYLVVDAPGQKRLQQWTVGTEQTMDLIEPSSENFGYPVPWKDYVLYNSPYSGIDNIYALDTRSGERFQVTSRPYGAFNPAPSASGDLLYFNDYTFYGHDVASMPLDPDSWIPLAEATVLEDDTYRVWVDQEKEHLDVLDKVGDELYAGYEWAGFPGLFNPYSWGAVIEDVNGNAEVGLSLQDELSTMRASATAGFNAGEQVWRYGLDFSYQKYFPIFDLSFDAGPRVVRTINRSGNVVDEAFSEQRLGLDVRLPLVLTRSAYLQQLTVTAGVDNLRVTDYSTQVGRPVNQVGAFESLNSFQYRIFYALQRRQAQRDLNPRLGMSVLAQLR